MHRTFTDLRLGGVGLRWSTTAVNGLTTYYIEAQEARGAFTVMPLPSLAGEVEPDGDRVLLVAGRHTHAAPVPRDMPQVCGVSLVGRIEVDTRVMRPQCVEGRWTGGRRLEPSDVKLLQGRHEDLLTPRITDVLALVADVIVANELTRPGAYWAQLAAAGVMARALGRWSDPAASVPCGTDA